MPKLKKGQSKTMEEVLLELKEQRQEVAELRKENNTNKETIIALQNSNFLLSSIMSSNETIIIFSLDRNYRYTFFNEAHAKEMYNVWGVSIKLGARILDYIPGEKDRKKAEKNYELVLKGEVFLKIEEYGEWGNRFYYELQYNPLRDQKNNVIGVTLFISNVTKRMQAEEALRENEKKLEESEKLYRILAENSTDSIWLMQLDGTFLYQSPAVMQLRGYTPEEANRISMQETMTPQSMAFLEKLFAIEDAKPIKERWNALRFELEMFRKDRSKIWTEVSAKAVFDDRDQMVGIQGSTRDITERKNADKEKAKLEEQLQQAQKMEAIGTLAGGIAHDFNNILGVIMGYTDLTLDDPADIKEVIHNLKRIMSASDRAKDMVEQILAFSRKSEQTMMSVSIGKIIKEVLTFLRSSIPTTIEIHSDIKKGLGLIFGNATQINQILMNLCTNAAHAMKEKGGILEIGLKEIVFDKDSSGEAGIEPGRYQHLSVSDTGEGIREDIINRIFEPYFTTKKEGEGTGMGLAVIYGIVKNHGGIIKAYSELGKGTIFNVYFPVMESEIIKKAHDQQPVLMGNNEMVLFVDDEIVLVELGIKMLKKLGFQVESRSSSIEALEAFKADPDKFDLIVTDMTMPNMTGTKLAAEIHKIKPDLPVILCTGFSNAINKDNYKERGISALIMKPVVKRELATAIREVLDKKSEIK